MEASNWNKRTYSEYSDHEVRHSCEDLYFRRGVRNGLTHEEPRDYSPNCNVLKERRCDQDAAGFDDFLDEGPPRIRLRTEQLLNDRQCSIMLALDRLKADEQLKTATAREKSTLLESSSLHTLLSCDQDASQLDFEGMLGPQLGLFLPRVNALPSTPTFNASESNFNAGESKNCDASLFDKKKGSGSLTNLGPGSSSELTTNPLDGRIRREDNWTIIPPASVETVPNNGKGQVFSMSTEVDQTVLTPYQALIRKSLEYFTATEDDVRTKVQGRRKSIMRNQVGIRCRYCSHLPIKLRMRAAVYYPRSLPNLYQGAQNISCVHFQQCTEIPKDVVAALLEERPRKVISKGGRPYWVERCVDVGIYEDDNALWILPFTE